MRSFLRLMLILVALWGALRGDAARGESEVPDTGWATEFSDRIQEVFEESAEIEHAGLLGRVYFQSRITQSNVPNWAIRQYDDTAEISDALVNIPLWTFDFPTPLKVDLFLGYSEVKLDGSLFPERGRYDSNFPDSTFSYRRERNELGVSLFTEWNDRFRPFFQVGAKFDEARQVVVSKASHASYHEIIDGILIERMPFHYTIAGRHRKETLLLLKPGFEFDLLDSLSYRMTIDISSNHLTELTEFQNDLIYWPFRKLFVRGGVLTSINGKYNAFSLGVGIVY